MNHHNILRLVTAYEDPEEEVVIQITEFLSGGELFERILDSNEKLLESEIREYIRLVSGTRNVCLNLTHKTLLFQQADLLRMCLLGGQQCCPP